jgi:hypothetical protein
LENKHLAEAVKGITGTVKKAEVRFCVVLPSQVGPKSAKENMQLLGPNHQVSNRDSAPSYMHMRSIPKARHKLLL